jgi:uncharacterized OB-fold protein
MEYKNSFSVNAFFDYLKEKKLMGVKCLNCNNLMIPPRLICTECKKTNLEWFEFEGAGFLETFTILHVAPTPLKEKAPYILGIIKLNEGPLITGRIIDIASDKPENIRIGMSVKADFILESNATILAFKPNN